MTAALLAALVLAQPDPFDRGLFEDRESVPPTRLGVVLPAVAVTLDGSTAGPAAAFHASAAVRQAMGVEASAVTFDFLGGARAPRFAFQLLDLQQVYFGKKQGAVCAPAIFLFWPAGGCDSELAQVGFGAMALHTDTAFGKGTNVRFLEANARAVLPGAFGTWFQTVRVSPGVGASLDYASGVVGRLFVGLDVLARSLQTRWEAFLSVRWRPSFTDFTGDAVVHAELKVAYRFRQTEALVLFLGAAHNTRPERSIGAFLSRDEVFCAWVGLGFEGTGAMPMGGTTPNP